VRGCPTVLVLDDLLWADEASLAVWHGLAASISQLRLLLIGTCRPTPRTPEVRQIRASVVRHSGQVITLGPLPEPDVAVLVKAIVEASPGKVVGASTGRELRWLTAQAAGNPLYVRELVDAPSRSATGPGNDAFRNAVTHWRARPASSPLLPTSPGSGTSAPPMACRPANGATLRQW
jgi:hypothetical protein